jgi:hypothetical protein
MKLSETGPNQGKNATNTHFRSMNGEKSCVRIQNRSTAPLAKLGSSERIAGLLYGAKATAAQRSGRRSVLKARFYSGCRCSSKTIASADRRNLEVEICVLRMSALVYDLQVRLMDYHSARRAFTGSSWEARQAGTMQAAIETNRRTEETVR